MRKLEVACFSAEDAKLALEHGADRIEFCADYSSGGITPDLDEFILLRSQFPEAKIHVMIRPRGGDFVYSDYKIETMKAQIIQFEKAGANGFVFGVQNADDTIDIPACQALIGVLKNKDSKIIFHRAFDLVPNAETAIRQLIALNFSGILSSGKTNQAFDGINNLKKWILLTQGSLDIIVGGGVRSHNIEALVTTEAIWYHTAAWDLYNEKLDSKELIQV